MADRNRLTFLCRRKIKHDKFLSQDNGFLSLSYMCYGTVGHSGGRVWGVVVQKMCQVLEQTNADRLIHTFQPLPPLLLLVQEDTGFPGSWRSPGQFVV